MILEIPVSSSATCFARNLSVLLVILGWDIFTTRVGEEESPTRLISTARSADD